MPDVVGSPGGLARFLATVPMLDGLPESELEELARVLRRREAPAGEVLWHQGEEAGPMLLIVDGRVSVTVRLPGDGTAEVASLGPGEALGELPLLDGGAHSGTASVAEPATLLSLSRTDFAAMVSRRHPTAFALKRRIAGVACARLRRHLGLLAASLDGEPGPAAPAPIDDLEPAGTPDSRYVRRLGTLRAFDSMALWGFLTAGRYVRCPAGRTLVAEGTASPACYLTINGAVEKSVVRGDQRIRIGLAAPGQAFGYEGLIDGGPAPMTATARERALLLALPAGAFDRLFTGEEAGSRVFLDVVLRDLMATLRQALRPHAQLASSRPAAAAGPPAPRPDRGTPSRTP
jgi:CRP-like cAMP-binding protein